MKGEYFGGRLITDPITILELATEARRAIGD